MCALYFQAFYFKLFIPEWAAGTAVYYWFSDPEICLPNYLQPLIYSIINTDFGVKVFTWGAIFLECLLFLGLFIRNYRFRKWLLGIGFFLHFSIGLFHGFWSFFFSMAAGLLLYLGKTHFTSSE
jgi:antimicrobial peptide system SdpB family protein